MPGLVVALLLAFVPLAIRSFAAQLGPAKIVKGPQAGTFTHHGPWPAPASVPLPASVPPGSCGAWSAVNSPQAIAADKHGQPTSCFLVGQSWVVTTVHSSGPPEVGVLDCGSSKSCLNGQVTHNLTAFTWRTAPGGTTLKVVHADGSAVQLYDGSQVVSFNVKTRGFRVMTGVSAR